MRKLYSPMRYPGGKALLARLMISVIAQNNLREPHYIEPYAGGAGAGLELLFEEYVDSITINDADPRIYAFWLAATKKNEALADLIMSTEVSVDEWHRQRAIYKKCDRRRTLALGFATFFLNRTTRSGVIHNGGPIGGYDQSGNYTIDARFNRANLVRRIQRIGVYSDRITVRGGDGLTLLDEINRSTDTSRDTFVYLDPPYYEKGAELYLNRYTHKEHEALAEYLHRSAAFPWIMTYDNVPAIRDLYRHFRQTEFSLDYSAYERRTGREVLIYPENISLPSNLNDHLPSVA